MISLRRDRCYSRDVMRDHDVMLEEADVRAMVRLVGDVAGLDTGHSVKKRVLMDGLSRLVGADCWIWVVGRQADRANEVPSPISVMHGGLTPEQVAIFADSYSDPSPDRLPAETLPVMAELRRGRHFTRTREQVVPDDEQWYHHPHTQTARRKWGVDHFIFSIFPLPDSPIYSAVGLHRRAGRSNFTPRERRIAHILCGEVEWLHGAGLPEDGGAPTAGLTPRLRGVLVLLLEGMTRAQIAHHLHLSEHTISDYVKTIYAHFGVNSRARLMRWLMAGDGGDETATSSRPRT